MLMHSDAPYSLTRGACKCAFDFSASGSTQALPARPDLQRPDFEPARFLLFGEQRKHRRIACKKQRLIFVQIRKQARQRIENRKAARRNPWIAVTDALPRSDAGEVIARRGDQCSAPAFSEHAPGVLRSKARWLNMHRHQRVERRHGIGVLHVNARDARSSRALPNDVAVEITLADMFSVREKRFDRC
jgi:hypothetical protein